MTNAMRGLAAGLAALTLCGCATARHEASTAPDLTPPAGAPAPPHATLYTDCLADAISARRLELSADASTQLLRFTCKGAPALAFYTALGPRSAAQRSEWRRDARVWRSTNAVKRDLFGVDYCSARETGDDAQCVVTLNAGGFLTAP